MATTIAQIGGFELWDILQLAQTSRMSIKLSVESPHGTGSMYFQGGNLLHAVAGDDEGDEAVNIILDWREGSVSSSQLPEDCPTTVRHSSIVALLMDRARQRDEQSREKPPPPPPRSQPPPPPPAKPAAMPAPPVIPSAPLPPAPAAPANPPATSHQAAKPPTTRPPSQPEAAPVLPDKELSEMDLRAVKLILEEIDDHLMGGLMSVDIISKASGMSIAGINSAPKACTLFNKLSEQLHTSLTRSEDALARGINKFIIEGDNGLYIFVIELDDRHRWAMLVDGGKTQLGMAFVIIPEIQPRLVEALANH